MRLFGVGILIAALILLVACDQVAALQLQNTAACESDEETSPASDIAPPYEEIRIHIDRLFAHTATTRISKEESLQIMGYLEGLSGKKVVNWCGWVWAVSPTKQMAAELEKRSNEEYKSDYRLYVSMEDPTDASVAQRHNPIRIRSLTRSQAEMFSAWSRVPTNDDDTIDIIDTYEKVAFSGTIMGVLTWEEIELELSDFTLIR